MKNIAYTYYDRKDSYTYLETFLASWRHVCVPERDHLVIIHDIYDECDALDLIAMRYPEVELVRSPLYSGHRYDFLLQAAAAMQAFEPSVVCATIEWRSVILQRNPFDEFRKGTDGVLLVSKRHDHRERWAYYSVAFHFPEYLDEIKKHPAYSADFIIGTKVQVERLLSSLWHKCLRGRLSFEPGREGAALSILMVKTPLNGFVRVTGNESPFACVLDVHHYQFNHLNLRDGKVRTPTGQPYAVLIGWHHMRDQLVRDAWEGHIMFDGKKTAKIDLTNLPKEQMHYHE